MPAAASLGIRARLKIERGGASCCGCLQAELRLRPVHGEDSSKMAAKGTTADPESLFTMLERIGKGSFGEVFKG